MSRAVIVFSFFCLIGCGSHPYPRTAADQQMLGPVSIRIHPTFTQIKDWTGDRKLDGIEAVLEIQDQFGEPIRSTGTVRFELYTFRSAAPERRGIRLGQPWTFSLNTKDEQATYWNQAVRGYSFRLPYAYVRNDRAYVLTAQLDLTGGRLFDELVVEASPKEGFHGDRRAQRAPSESPGHGF